jgi:putative ABC transport system substrate-binding protein
VCSAQGKVAQLPELASELVRLPVDVLVTWQTPPAFAARDATKDIPIVMVSVGDPVATGIVTNLSRPHGNITGNTAIAAEIMSKNMDLIRETLPKASRVAAFANSIDPSPRRTCSTSKLQQGGSASALNALWPIRQKTFIRISGP